MAAGKAIDLARVKRIVALVRKYGPKVLAIITALRAAGLPTAAELPAIRAGVKAKGR